MHDWKREGDDFLHTFPEAAIGIAFSNLYETREGVHGEITVESTLPDRYGHVHWARLNLSSTSAREGLCRTLTKRVSGPEWATILEAACTRTAIEYRAGEPIVDLSTIPAPNGQKYLVSGLIPQNNATILFGDGGCGKSFLALAIAMALHEGRPLPSRLCPSISGETLYLDWETCLEDQRERLGALAAGWGLEYLPRIHYQRMHRGITDEARALRAHVARLGVKLVIVDSLGPAVGGSLKDDEAAIPAMNAINNLGATTLCLAHITKADAAQSGGKATIFGSAFFRNMSRQTWEVRRAEGTDANEMRIGLYHRKSNRGPLQGIPIGLSLLFSGTEDVLDTVRVTGSEVADDPELASFANLGYRLRALLRQGKQSTKDLAEITGAKENTITHRLRAMTDVVNLVEHKGGRGNLAIWALRAHEVAE